ncbi:hypothetical protein V6N13_136600 [Hibiscus sabdariffa]
MTVRTVKVSNISSRASEIDIEEFFIFSGEIEYVEMDWFLTAFVRFLSVITANERSQVACITYKDPQGADCSSSFRGDDCRPDCYERAGSGVQVACKCFCNTGNNSDQEEAGLKKAEDVVRTMLVRGFIINKEKAFDEKSIDSLRPPLPRLLPWIRRLVFLRNLVLAEPW